MNVSARRTVRFAALLALIAVVPTPDVWAKPSACVESPGEDDVLDAIGPRGELTLRSGRRAILAGIRWPDDHAVVKEAVTWLSERRGAELTVAARGPPDRWGRIAIDAIHEGDDLAGGLVSAGLALVDAGEADILCRPDLLALEDSPRRRGEGVWEAPILDAADGAAYAPREGEFIVAKGRIVSTAVRDKRTYLNFTTREKRGLSVTVSKRTWRIMLERGLTGDTLRGRFVRVRGTVELWQGPMLDIASADMIEVLDGSAAPRR